MASARQNINPKTMTGIGTVDPARLVCLRSWFDNFAKNGKVTANSRRLNRP